MARLTDHAEFLQNFKRDVNECVRSLFIDGGVNIENTSRVLNRLETLGSNLGQAKRGGLVDEELFTSISTPLGKVTSEVSRSVENLRIGKSAFFTRLSQGRIYGPG